MAVQICQELQRLDNDLKFLPLKKIKKKKSSGNTQNFKRKKKKEKHFVAQNRDFSKPPTQVLSVETISK